MSSYLLVVLDDRGHDAVDELGDDLLLGRRLGDHLRHRKIREEMADDLVVAGVALPRQVRNRRGVDPVARPAAGWRAPAGWCGRRVVVRPPRPIRPVDGYDTPRHQPFDARDVL